MGVVIQIIKTANGFAAQNGVNKVRKLTLQIGEASAVMPKYVKMFYFDVIPDYPLLSDSELEIETVPVKAFCLDCGTEFQPQNECNCDDCRSLRGEDPITSGDYHDHTRPECPHCGSTSYKVIEGNTLYIKEMEVE